MLPASVPLGLTLGSPIGASSRALGAAGDWEATDWRDHHDLCRRTAVAKADLVFVVDPDAGGVTVDLVAARRSGTQVSTAD